MGGKLKKKTSKKVVKKVSKKASNKTSNKPFDYKTTIWVGLALVALILVVMAILKFNQNEKIDSSYFHDADNKIVITMAKDISALDNSEWESDVTHVVYYYEGNKIVAARAFYEYATEAEADEAYKHLGLGTFADNKRISGKFVVFDIKKSQYEDLSVEDLRQSRERLKQIDALILDYDEGYVKPRPAQSTD